MVFNFHYIAITFSQGCDLTCYKVVITLSQPCYNLVHYTQSYHNLVHYTQSYHNLVTTLYIIHNLITTLLQPCTLYATLSQPCNNLAFCMGVFRFLAALVMPNFCLQYKYTYNVQCAHHITLLCFV